MLELKNSPDKKSLLYLVTLLFCLPFYLFAQKKEQEKQAQIYYETADYYHALNTYKNLLINDTSNAQYAVRIAACMFYLKQSPDSILPYLQKASNKKLDESFYYLGKIYHLQNKFDEAINAYNIYLNTSQNRLLNNSIMQRELEITKTAKELFKRPVASTITNMGASINSKESDYAPLLTADENTIYFTSRRPETTGGKQDELGNYFEDIYTSHKNSKEWVAAKNLGAPVNSPTNDACTGISPDGQSLIIYRTQPNKLDGDLYATQLVDNVWTEPTKLGQSINSPYVETSACITMDNQTIYFSSNRPGGQGGMDLYMAKKLPNGEWALPINLGPGINTPYDEDAPFIHPNGQTLYFSSKGHNTMGGYDVYQTQLNEDEDLWSIPLNLGYPINTTDDDIFFVLSPDGQRGYLAGRRNDTYGSFDIYKVDFKGIEKTQDVVVGIVSEIDNDKRFISAKITLIDEDNHSISGIYQTNLRNGKFILLFNPNKRYKMVVESEGYNPIIRPLDGLQSPFKEGNTLVLMMSKTSK